MKTLLILFAVIWSTRANVSETLDNIAKELKEKTTDPLHNVEESISSDINYIKIAAKSADKILQTNNKDSDLTKLNFDEPGKLPFTPVPEMIQKEGYPVESYYVTTSDGYILNIFRIPHGKSGKNLDKVVYLQHGLLAASSDWVLFGSKHGLAYILADEGYDVWLGNCRGNIYSRNHTKWNPDKDEEFWKFSWHEIGVIDIPAMIDFILQTSGKQSLFHIGHSQGTTTFYVMTSMKPEYNAKIKHHISLAPVVFMNHIFSPLMRLIAPESNLLGKVLGVIGQNEFLPNHGFINSLTDTICSESVGKVLCKNALFALMGFSPKQINVSAIPAIMANYPAGASTRQVVHYGQEVNSGKFRQYNFGLLKNEERYKRLTPPDYDLSKVTAPITLMYADNDWFSAIVDVERLAGKLGSLKEKYLVPILDWNHLDFLFGNDAPSVLYNKVISVLAKS